jgi:hypothetical protein
VLNNDLIVTTSSEATLNTSYFDATDITAIAALAKSLRFSILTDCPEVMSKSKKTHPSLVVKCMLFKILLNLLLEQNNPLASSPYTSPTIRHLKGSSLLSVGQ